MISLTIRITIAVALAFIRIAGHKSPSFQAVAHLCVGGFYTASFVQFLATESPSQAYRLGRKSAQNAVIAVVLTVVEVICFLTQRGQ